MPADDPLENRQSYACSLILLIVMEALRAGFSDPSLSRFDIGAFPSQNQLFAPLQIDTEYFSRGGYHTRFRPYLQVIYPALNRIYRLRTAVYIFRKVDHMLAGRHHEEKIGSPRERPLNTVYRLKW
jgi:hypothetical protein